MNQKQIDALHVVAVRYRGMEIAEEDERGLDAYASSGIYEAAGAPYTIAEPRLPDDQVTGVAPDDLGALNGLIADEVAAAQRAGHALLMTGGNCNHMTGVVGGLQDAHGPAARIGLLWLDAHGDFNTPQTTLTGSLGGMPVAVAAGLAFPTWREGAHIVAPLPSDRIVMVDVRNLDPAEAQLIEAVGIPVAAPAPGFPGQDLSVAVADLATRCDLIYLHIDSDILDISLVPGHATEETDGPDVEQVLGAVEAIMATGKVAAFAVVSVYAGGAGRERNLASGMALIEGGLSSWRRHGMPGM